MNPSRRRLALLAAGAALACACSFHVTRHGHASGAWFGLEHAERQESHDLDLASVERLRIDGVGGDVDVRVDAAATPRLEAHFTAYARSREAARELLDASSLSLEKGGGELHVTVKADTSAQIDDVVARNSTADADLTLVVPSGLALEISTSYGDVAIAGPVGAVDVRAPQGDVRVADSGAVTVESSSGKIELARVRGAIDARTNYDSIEIDDVDGESVRAATSSGAVRLRDATADRIEIASSYDDVVLGRVAARSGDVDVTVKTSSGNVRVDTGGRGQWRLRTSYGDIRVRGISGRLDARTSSGAIDVGDFRGEVSAATSYDDVRLSGELHVVDAESSSGAIAVDAWPGSSVERPWLLKTRYDDIVLELPDDLVATLEAKTRGGRIRSDFGVEIERDDAPRATVRLGGGGTAIVVEASNGDVKIRRH